MSRGVPQGDILGTLLFNIFINDLAYAMNESKLLSYTDDTNIHCSHRNPHVVEQTVNRDLDNAAIWFRENGMRANPEKYQAIVLGNTSQDVTIKSGATEIPTTDEIELLGVTLDRNLKFRCTYFHHM